MFLALTVDIVSPGWLKMLGARLSETNHNTFKYDKYSVLWHNEVKLLCFKSKKKSFLAYF